MGETQGLLVAKKAEILLQKVYPSLKNFPKYETHTLCHDIKDAFYSLIGYLEMADAVPSLRKKYAQTADGYLRKLNVMFRLARNQHYISKGFYRIIDTDLSEIQKLLSGYIKSA